MNFDFTEEQKLFAESVRRFALAHLEKDALARAHRAGDQLEPLSGQESHMIVHAAAANALVFIPRGEGELPEGAEVRYLPV